MNPEKPMEDLEPEAQAKIKQLMYDEQQKRLGLPTSEQQQYQDVLKKAWNMEVIKQKTLKAQNNYFTNKLLNMTKGSPFKGTPFDPSVIKSPSDKNDPMF